MPVGDGRWQRKSKQKGDGYMTDGAIKSAIPVWEKMTLTIEEASAYSNIGLNKLRDMCDEPNCNFVLFVGRKKLIKRKAFEDYISKRYEI